MLLYNERFSFIKCLIFTILQPKLWLSFHTLCWWQTVLAFSIRQGKASVSWKLLSVHNFGHSSVCKPLYVFHVLLNRVILDLRSVGLLLLCKLMYVFQGHFFLCLEFLTLKPNCTFQVLMKREARPKPNGEHSVLACQHRCFASYWNTSFFLYSTFVCLFLLQGKMYTSRLTAKGIFTVSNFKYLQLTKQINWRRSDTGSLSSEQYWNRTTSQAKTCVSPAKRGHPPMRSAQNRITPWATLQQSAPLLRMTVLFVPFCSCGTRLLTAGVTARPQGRWRRLLDERKALVSRVARAAESVGHLVRRGKVHLSAPNTFLLGVSCETQMFK